MLSLGTIQLFNWKIKIIQYFFNYSNFPPLIKNITHVKIII